MGFHTRFEVLRFFNIGRVNRCGLWLLVIIALDFLMIGKHNRKEIFSSVSTAYKLATLVDGDPKAPFSIATTPRCRGGHYSIALIAPPYNTEF